MSTIPITGAVDRPWVLPSRGRVGMFALIVAESAIFTIFVVAYIYNIGRSISGPTPQQVLEIPIFSTVCLLSSSLTIWISERALHRDNMKMFGLWWLVTWILGVIFLAGTAIEWRKLIYQDGLTIHTNLFGTTYYSLVGLHASHVTVGLIGILTVLILTLSGKVGVRYAERIGVFALYWHFVDAVWVVVFTVVYIVGR